MYACMYVCMRVCMYVCVYVCVYVCMYACVYVCVCMHVRMYVCMLLNTKDVKKLEVLDHCEKIVKSVKFVINVLPLIVNLFFCSYFRQSAIFITSVEYRGFDLHNV